MTFYDALIVFTLLLLGALLEVLVVLGFFQKLRQQIVIQLKPFIIFFQQILCVPGLLMEAYGKKVPWRYSKSIEKEIKAHYKSNTSLNSYINDSERPLIHASFSFVVCMIFAISLVAFLAGGAFLDLESSVGNDSDRVNNLSQYELWKVILTVQGTIIGIVYPIIIGLVQFIFTNKSRSPQLSIYFDLTKAQRFGVSSLALISSILLALFFAENFNNKWLLAITVFIYSWFFYNLYGIFHFITLSLKFIRPDYRYSLVRDYIVLRSFPYEISELLARVFPYNFSKRYVPEMQDIIRHGWSSSENSQVQLNTKNHFISDVRGWFLYVGVSLWWKRYKNQDGVYLSLRYPMKETLLKEQLILVGSDTGESLTLLEKTFFRYAAILSKKKRVNDVVEIAKTVEEQIAIIESAIYTNDITEFDEELKNLKELYVFLFNIFYVEGSNNLNRPYKDKAQNISYAEGSAEIWLGTAILNRWFYVFWEVPEKAVAAFPNEHYWKLLTYLPSTLYVEAKDVLPKSAINANVTNLSRLGFSLLDWWQKKLQYNEGAISYKKPITLPISLNKTYESALKYWIAGYERLLSNIFKVSSRKEALELSGIEKESIKSLYAGAIHIFYLSIYRGDERGALWLQEMLLNWNKTLQELRIDDGYLALNSSRASLINIEMVDDEFSKIIKNLKKERYYQNYDNERLVVDMFSQAITNYWTDGCIVLCASLLRLGSTAPTQENLAIIMLNRILNGDVHSLDKSIASPLLKIDNILLSLFRIFSDGWRGEYANHIESIVERLSEDSRKTRISGRIYSMDTNNNILSLSQEIFLLMVVKFLHTSKELPFKEINLPKLDADYLDMDRLKDVIQKFKSFIEMTKTLKSDDELLSLLNNIKGLKDLNKGLLDDSLPILQKMLEDNLAELEGKITLEIKNKQVDKKLLKELTKWAYEGFSSLFLLDYLRHKEGGDELLLEVSEDFIKHSILIEGHSKESLFEGRDISSDKEWLIDCGREYGHQWLLRDIFTKIILDTVEVESEGEFWARLKDEASKMRDPMLFTRNISTPRCLYEWISSQSMTSDDTLPPDDFKITRVYDVDTSEYVGKISGKLNNGKRVQIKMYSVPVGNKEIILVDGDSLAGISFENEEAPLNAVFEPNSEDETVGTLKINFSYKLAWKKSKKKAVSFKFKSAKSS